MVITSTDTGGKVLQKTLTNIKPTATNAQMKTFGQALNNLTTNTYGSTALVDRVEVDTAENKLPYTHFKIQFGNRVWTEADIEAGFKYWRQDPGVTIGTDSEGREFADFTVTIIEGGEHLGSFKNSGSTTDVYVSYSGIYDDSVSNRIDVHALTQSDPPLLNLYSTRTTRSASAGDYPCFRFEIVDNESEANGNG